MFLLPDRDVGKGLNEGIVTENKQPGDISDFIEIEREESDHTSSGHIIITLALQRFAIELELPHSIWRH